MEYYPSLPFGYWPLHKATSDQFTEFGEDDKPNTWKRSIEEGKEFNLAEYKDDQKPASYYAYLLHKKASGRNEEELKAIRSVNVQVQSKKRKNEVIKCVLFHFFINNLLRFYKFLFHVLIISLTQSCIIGFHHVQPHQQAYKEYTEAE